MTEVAILGGGGFAREVIWLIEDLNRKADTPQYKIVGFIDVREDVLPGVPYLGNDEWAWKNLPKSVAVVNAIGDPQGRAVFGETYIKAGFPANTLIHPDTSVGSEIHAGNGSIICAGARITKNVSIGMQVIVNLNATIGHDSVIGNYVNICPGVNLSGNTKLGNRVFVGSGATVLPGISIGEDAEIGAGAVVTKDVPKGVVAKGVPARW